MPGEGAGIKDKLLFTLKVRLTDRRTGATLYRPAHGKLSSLSFVRRQV
jgi:hypothetical protein